MANVIVVGSQWGDEGKGKIVDWLSEKADIIVRFQGGHNAGHTLVIDGKIYKLNLLPSGVVREGKISVIGSGVVIDPTALLNEIEKIAKQGINITPQNLIIAENAALILPLHQEMDNVAEISRGKVGRRAIRICDLSDDDLLKERIKELLYHHNALRRGVGVDEATPEEVFDYLVGVRDKILPFAKPVWMVLDQYAKEGRRILFEGAQGVMLDFDHGTYPFVTSSNIVASAAFTGSGLGIGNALKSNLNVLGITKAYTTRVGSGPFPTEQENEIGKRLGERGHEFGTTTGRKRRCGWFDAAMVRQSIKISGITGITLTKLDVLDGFEKLKICIGYKYNGKVYDYYPASIKAQAEVEPIYEEMDGWSESTEGARSYKELPANAVKYIRRIEELVETPIAVLSTSPEREDTILIKDPFSY